MLQIVHGLRIVPAFVGRLPTETVHVGSFPRSGLASAAYSPKDHNVITQHHNDYVDCDCDHDFDRQ
jgi:hypothetical protein